ncbi:hypothetical protein [Paraburkholderia xenovorans]|jgi:hypothetical protein
MRVADVLRELGRPIAYYPFLARYLGGVNAAVFFCQIFYWQDKATSEFGVHKTVDELEHETGLSYEEQRAARTKLRAAGVLIETAKRIEHRTYFRVDEDALELLLSSEPPARKAKKSSVGTSGKSTSRNGKSPSREVDKVHSANLEKPMPPDGENRARGKGDPHSVNGTEITAETTAATRAAEAVDNSAVAAAEDEKAQPNPERELTDLLVSLEAARGKSLSVDRNRDRVHVLTWVGKGVTAARLREAHALAVAARSREGDERPTYAGFVSTFIDAEAAAPVTAESQAQVDWWLAGEEVLVAAGERFGARPKRRDEPLPLYRAVVARAAGKGPWIDAILRDAQRGGGQFQQMIVATLGEALLPVDWYAS